MKNPPAFPNQLYPRGDELTDGMTLLDYFAGQALIDIRIRTHIARAEGRAVFEESPKDKATEAYLQAQAMMEEREKLTK